MATPFLNPWALTGLAAVGLPVLIHLLNRHRAVTIEWGAMVLLRRIMTLRSRQIRLEDILLMLLRCLVILLVVLAVSRPVTRWAGIVRKPEVGMVVAVDASMSMAHRTGLESRFDQALARTREIVRNLEPGAPVTLVLLGNHPRVLLRNTGYDAGRFERALRESKPFDEPVNLERCLPELASLLSDIKAPARELYVVTDGQTTTWGKLSAETREEMAEIHRLGRMFLATVDCPGSRNLAVTRLGPAAGLLRVGSLVRYEAEIRNFSPDPEDNVEVSLVVDDQVVEKRFVGRLGPGEVVSVSLYTVLTREGILRVSVRLGDDPLPDDNAAYAVIHVRRTVRVLCVDGEPSDRPHGGAAAYVSTALAPNSLAHSESTVEVETVPWLNLAAMRFRDYDVVVLADVPDLVPEAAAALRNFVEQGGGLIFFLGRNVKPEALNQHFGQGDTPLLPGELVSQVSDPTRAQDGTPVDWDALDHPIVRPLRALPLDMLGENRVYRLYKVRPLPESRIILKLAGGDPLVLEKSFGRGKVLLFTTSADRDWNNIVVSPAYPILVNQSVMYLLQQFNEQPVTIPQPLTMPLPALQPGAEVTVTDPTGVVNHLRAIQRDGQTVAELPETSRPGFFTIQTDKDATAIPIAVNLAPGESDVKTLDAQTLAGSLAESDVRVVAADQDIASAVAESRVGHELWLALACVAAGLLAIEGLLAGWYTRRNGESKSARGMFSKMPGIQ